MYKFHTLTHCTLIIILQRIHYIPHTREMNLIKYEIQRSEVWGGNLWVYNLNKHLK